jgi:hypothetical protein
MEKWVRGNRKAVIVNEPDDIQIVEPHKRLYDLKVDAPNERTFEDYIAEVSRREDPKLTDAEAWKAYRTKMTEALGRLLGESQKLPPVGKSSFREIKPAWAEGLKVEEFLVASEDKILIPGYVIYPPEGRKPASVELFLSPAGRSAVEKDAQLYLKRAREGAAVILADLRFSGDYAAAKLAGKGGNAAGLAIAWDRNGALWGRPVAGLMVTDLESVIDYLAKDRGLPSDSIAVTAKNDAPLALSALFAACLDPRIKSLDVDFAGRTFTAAPRVRRSPEDLPLVCNILEYGDIPQWASVVADRRVTLRGVPSSNAELDWLKSVFQSMEGQGNLRLIQ